MFIISFCNAQNRKIDSLKKNLSQLRDDNNKINTYFHLADELNVQGEFDSSIFYSKMALQLYVEATTKDKVTESNIFLELGHSYRNKSDYPAALENYFKAMKIKEEINDPGGKLRCLSSIGLIYSSEGDYQKSLNYLFVAKKMAEQLKDKQVQGVLVGNIGNIYWYQRKDSLALDYYFKALNIMQELNDKKNIAVNTNNIASIYAAAGDFEKAQEFFLKALKLNEELGYKFESAIMTGNVGSTYTKLKKYKEAEIYIKKAILLSDSIGDIEGLMEGNFNLHELYTITGKHDLAFIHYKKYVAAKDSISNEENIKKQTETEMNYEFDKKETESRIDQEKKDAVTKIVIYSVSGGLFLVLILAIFIYRGFRQKQKINIVITQQKEEVERQKHLVEEKQKEILDSIYYARRIQRSLLPFDKYIQRNLNKLKNT